MMAWHSIQKLKTFAIVLGIAVICGVFYFSGLITGTSVKLPPPAPDQSELLWESKLSVAEAPVVYGGNSKQRKVEAAATEKQHVLGPWVTPVNSSPPRSGLKPPPVRTHNSGLPSSEQLSSQESRVLERFIERRQHMLRQCAADPDADPATEVNIGTLLVNEKHHVIFQKIRKNSSTFWKKVLTILGDSNRTKTVWDMSGPDEINSKFFRSWNLSRKSPVEREEYLNQSSKVVFVRDPYERLFSGYVDRFLRPGPLGKKIQIIEFIGGHSSDKNGCTSEVNFQQFLQYVTNSENFEVNPHHTPQYTACHPCLLDFDYIGHLDTFREDVPFILRHAFHVDPSAVLGSGQVDQSGDMANMKDTIQTVWRTFPKFKGCKTPYNTMNRIWTMFQVRGYLSVQQQFPLSRAEASRTSQEQLIELLRRAYQNSGDRALVKAQRQQALQEAFRSVSLPVLTRVEKYVLQDCRLFNYNCSLQARFQLHSAPPTPVFRMQQVLMEH